MAHLAPPGIIFAEISILNVCLPRCLRIISFLVIFIISYDEGEEEEENGGTYQGTAGKKSRGKAAPGNSTKVPHLAKAFGQQSIQRTLASRQL